MPPLFQVGDRLIQTEEILYLQHRYQLTQSLIQGVIIDRAISEIPYSQTELDIALERFYQSLGLPSLEQQQFWQQQQKFTIAQVESLAIRPVLVEKFKRLVWEDKIEAYFIQRKSQLDRVVFSSLQHPDFQLLEELYFAIREGESSFSDLAEEYSQGPSALTGGLIGPIPLGNLHPHIMQVLSSSQPKQLWRPIPLEKMGVILRLEKILPAQLDDKTRQVLLNELFEAWLLEQAKQISLSAL